MTHFVRTAAAAAPERLYNLAGTAQQVNFLWGWREVFSSVGFVVLNGGKASSFPVVKKFIGELLIKNIHKEWNVVDM